MSHPDFRFVKYFLENNHRIRLDENVDEVQEFSAFQKRLINMSEVYVVPPFVSKNVTSLVSLYIQHLRLESSEQLLWYYFENIVACDFARKVIPIPFVPTLRRTARRI